jgi:hypothetical protein
MRKITKLKNNLVIRYLFYLLLSIPEIIFITITICVSFYYRFFLRTKLTKKRIVLGSDPLINNLYWKKAINKFAFAETYTTSLYTNFERHNWDIIISERWRFIPSFFRNAFSFCEVLLKYDFIITSFNGFAINNRPYWRIQALCFKICNIKSIIIPYGSDAYVYPRISSNTLLYGLLGDYPGAAKRSKSIESRINYWNKHADAVIPGFMGFDGIGRWDVLVCSPLIIDTSFWCSKNKFKPQSDQNSLKPIVVGHFPNHKIFKGTQYIEAAVEMLQEEGFNVELRIYNNISNNQISELMKNEIDIYYDQINFIGYGMAAIEAMSCSLPVLANLQDKNYTDALKYYSYLIDCPIVSVDQTNLLFELRKLLKSQDLRYDIGFSGREYVERYHSIDAGSILFKQLFESLVDNSKIELKLFESNPRLVLKSFDSNRDKV